MITAAQISRNFSVAKVLAILMVVTGHYFDGSLLWIPTTVALFVFAFSSGYFTALRYGAGFSVRPFWRAKFGRLGSPLLVINIFLLVLFLVEQRRGILSVQTPIAMLGMSGFVDWFDGQHTSPFGNGLWFFTALLLFYLNYPFLAWACATPQRARGFLLIWFVLTSLLQHTLPMNHALWLVVLGFGFGVFAARHGWQPNGRAAAMILILLLSAMIFVNTMLHFNGINYALLIGLSLTTVGLLLVVPLSDRPFRWALPLTGCVLEIYFIHTYLFIHSPALSVAMGYVLSLLLTVAIAWLLSIAATSIARQFGNIPTT